MCKLSDNMQIFMEEAFMKGLFLGRYNIMARDDKS